ncbi:MAG: hypothetical protein ABFS45_12340 [Pseudomonadota bacterium]
MCFLFAPRSFILVLIVFALFLQMMPGSGMAQERAVQVSTGRFEPGKAHIYLMPELKAGQTVYVYGANRSGNFDPFVALANPELDEATLAETFEQRVVKARKEGRDPLIVVPKVADEFFLAWDDDDGKGHAAALEYTIASDGDYKLLVGGSPFSPGQGEFTLTVGLNAPEVLEGISQPTQDNIAMLIRVGMSDQATFAVQELTANITKKTPDRFYALQDVEAGDSFYAYVEAASGDLKPILRLVDFGGKLVGSGNMGGTDTHAGLQYTFAEQGTDYLLWVESCCEGKTLTTGAYRLQLGLNAPGVLEAGGAEATVPKVLEEPIEVKVGIQMDQITGVDQKAENFGVVSTLRMEWRDRKLAFNPDSCNCRFKTFHGNSFAQFATANHTIWPEYMLFNQQGRRATHNLTAVVFSDGNVILIERFSVTLQAPDFNFTKFPFDTQKFFIRVRSVFPDKFFVFSNPEELSSVGTQLGEEEWVIKEWSTEVETIEGNSQYSFRFLSNRHLTFYVVRFFAPVLIIILVSWFTFFLKDYGKRVDVASANLLIFIAFNFTISNSLPRLGYLTLMDVILVSTFIITALVVMLNVWLKRMEVTRGESTANNIDKYSIWLYPLLYLAGFVIIGYLFAGPGGP